MLCKAYPCRMHAAAREHELTHSTCVRANASGLEQASISHVSYFNVMLYADFIVFI